ATSDIHVPSDAPTLPMDIQPQDRESSLCCVRFSHYRPLLPMADPVDVGTSAACRSLAVKHDARTRPEISPAQARAMYQQTLNGWVTHTLRLDRKSLNRPSARTSSRAPGDRTTLYTIRPSDRAVG